MHAPQVGRIIMTVVAGLTVAAEVAFTWLGWTGQHIFNPLWHPHAKFHAAQMSWTISGLCVLSVCLAWGRRLPARPTALVLAVIHLLWWGGEFFAMLVPGTSASPDLTRPNTFSLLGVQVYGNLFFAGLMIALSIVGCALLARESRPTIPVVATIQLFEDQRQELARM